MKGVEVKMEGWTWSGPADRTRDLSIHQPPNREREQLSHVTEISGLRLMSLRRADRPMNE